MYLKEICFFVPGGVRFVCAGGVGGKVFWSQILQIYEMFDCMNAQKWLYEGGLNV